MSAPSHAAAASAAAAPAAAAADQRRWQPQQQRQLLPTTAGLCSKAVGHAHLWGGATAAGRPDAAAPARVAEARHLTAATWLLLRRAWAAASLLLAHRRRLPRPCHHHWVNSKESSQRLRRMGRPRQGPPRISNERWEHCPRTHAPEPARATAGAVLSQYSPALPSSRQQWRHPACFACCWPPPWSRPSSPSATRRTHTVCPKVRPRGRTICECRAHPRVAGQPAV
jgi:hypothetical protein